MDLMAMRRGLLEMITHTSGGDAIPAGCEIGVFTPTEDENTHTVNHSLGVVPRSAFAIGILNGASSTDNKNMIMHELLMSDFADDTFDITKTTAKCPHNVFSINGTSGIEYQQTSTYLTYPASMTSSSVTFATGRYYGGKFKAGKSYVYILTK